MRLFSWPLVMVKNEIRPVFPREQGKLADIYCRNDMLVPLAIQI